ncbi:hypothetical protein HMT_5 [Clostridium phage HM T]|uniref:Uncharacterized protein n=1 Tax=Clostridium saccharoperbutylacetonicum N1-4(HMT) TaxID=931276 RepID=M1MA10_9CLOT|nr:hypothetical protein [Clostridium saccharoperbutylacetonicum]AMB17417.1 hypothetical protein HMT_5 [Clostridium phage HM T]AGF54769.1 hypothetical protein Cspa_c09930 [Clostridium saccharoperbutylacetonicum N1-4(HMT)]NRT58710.1 hypothetical protein [Clostridium saccharoperbutylacetonicum]NSB27899.1 hypothetical protein [Clostridium saccharoperbutylacetonicum]NSB41382.1 hypothetical protein [Clostridium saccharoperbutylacetonicum]
MGKDKHRDREEITLIDFLYKDTDLINSFYSQIFGGDLTNVVKSELSTDETNSLIEGNGGFIKGNISSKNSNNENITHNINPYDHKVIELLETFNLKKTTLSEAASGTIIAIDGTLTYRNFDVVTQIIPFATKNNLVPEFNTPVNPNLKGKSKQNTLGAMIYDMIKLIPYGLEFGLDTPTRESANCILKQDCLTISPDDLFRSYGISIPNSWTVIGILDTTEVRNSTNIHEFRQLIDSSSATFSSMVLNENTNIIRPIAIYRKLVV